MRLIMLVIGSVFALLATTTGGVFAQDPGKDPGLEICTTLYSQHIVDERSSYRTEDRLSSLRNVVVKEDFQSYADLSSWAGKAGVIIPVLDELIGLNAEAKSKSETFREQFSHFKSESISEAQSRLNMVDLDSHISQVLMAVYQDCERNYFKTVLTNLSQIVTVTPQNPPDSFLLQISAHFPAGPQGLQVDSIEPADNVKCSENNKRITLPHKYNVNEALFNCTKPVDKEVKLLVRTNAGVPEASIILPRRENMNDSLRAQIATLRTAIAFSSPPMGSIIPFYGSMFEAEGLQNRGWWICDGRPVNDSKSTYNNRATPDLRNKFLMGSSTQGSSGGSASTRIQDQIVHSHTDGGFGPPSIYSDPFTHMQGAHVWTTDVSIYSQGLWSGVDVPTIPPYSGVIYILKVRQ